MNCNDLFHETLCKNINKGVNRKSQRNRNSVSVLPNSVTCNHTFQKDWDMFESYCSKCYMICGPEIKTEKYKNNPKPHQSPFTFWKNNWAAVYNRNEWLKETVEYLSGRKNESLDVSVWLDLCREVPDPCTWFQVYTIFKKYGLQEYWVCFPSYVNLPIVLNEHALSLATQNIDLSHTKYRVCHLYLVYKFTQIHSPGNEKYIPLHRSKKWCEKTDLWWKEICEQNKWPYYPTKIHEISWNKREFLQTLAKYVKQHNSQI